MPASEYILKHLFQNDPIRWLNEDAFSAASMKKIKRFTVVCCVICRTYYQNERNRHVLEGGLQVPGEVTPVSHLPLPFPWTVFVSEY